MKQMKSTVSSMTPQATRLAVFALAVTAVLGTPVTAQSVDSPNSGVDAAINRSAPARPAAARPAAPARNNNTARPASSAARPAANRAQPSAASRPAASRPAAASKPAAARPNTATHPNSAAHSNAAGHNTAAHPNTNTAHSNAAHSNTAHTNTAKAGNSKSAATHAAGARGGERGGPAAKNAAYKGGENLHGGRRIADGRFRGSFGREHQFHIGHPVMIGGQASFQFGGIWFGLVDVWPAAWLYTDAVYVDFVEGEYVLVNVAHPEVTVAVSAGDAVPATCTADSAVPVAPVVAAPVVAVPVVAAPVVVVPTYRYFTYHYWRHYWL